MAQRGPSSGGGSSSGGSGSGLPPGSAAEAWRPVLELGAGPAGAAGAAGRGEKGSAAGGPPSRSPFFLAARVAAWKLLAAGGSAGGGAGSGPTASSGCAGELSYLEEAAALPAAGPQPPLNFVTHVPGLPGVSFPAPRQRQLRAGPPPPSEAPSPQPPAGGTSAAGGIVDGSLRALALLARDPDPLGPAGLALAALEMAQQHLSNSGPAAAACVGAPMCADSSSGSSGGGSGAGGGATLDGGAAAARVLVWLAQGAAARVVERRQQRALLQAALCGPALAQLRAWAEADSAVQGWARQGLLALSNRLAGAACMSTGVAAEWPPQQKRGPCSSPALARASLSGVHMRPGTPANPPLRRLAPAEDSSGVRVWGDERQRVATLVREVLPFALLAPAAALERLLADALSHAGQVRGSTLKLFLAC